MTTSWHYNVLNNSDKGNSQVLGRLEIARAEGSFLWDVDGTRYIDLYNNATLPLGHNTDILREVFSHNHPLNVGLYMTVHRKQLLDKITSLFPGYACFQLNSSGTAANEGMIRYAMAITGRNGFCGFQGSFHGRSKAMASVSDMEPCNGERISGYFQLPYPGYQARTGGYYADEAGAIHPTVAELAGIIDQHGAENIAGMIIEPILSKPGIRPPNGWLKRVKEEVLDPRGILLLADEYLTAGRVGAWSECSEQEVLPAIFSFGKMFISGMSFAGIGCLPTYASAVASVKANDTSGGQSAACQNALITIDAIIEQNLLHRSRELCQYFLQSVSQLNKACGVERIFAKGAFWTVEFSSREMAFRVGQLCLEDKVLVAVIKKGIRLTPALNIHLPVLEEGLSRMNKAIRTAANQVSGC